MPDKVLVFDLGGVLIDNSGPDRLAAMLPHDSESGDIRLRWLASPAVRQFERGQISANEFASSLVKEWGLRLGPHEFIKEFAMWLKDFYPGTRELLTSLKSRHRVLCLSNSNEVHWARFPELPTLFEFALSSHQIGHVKPDREAFQCVLDKTSARPEDVYFFDDMLPNVQAARGIGMNAFQVEGLSGVEAALRDEGLHAS
jgi:glucose-1-phosphatase